MLRLKFSLFRRKARTHGIGPAVFYTAQYFMRIVWNGLCVRPFLRSYSQQFEDRIVDNILGRPPTGSYLDIGAYDPHDLSNTKRFYLRGWRGYNIEPNPDHFHRFMRARPDDMNINVALSNARGRLVFFRLVPSSLSTFSEERARELNRMGAKIRGRIEVPVITMRDLFEQYLSRKTIDFCTIDTEGMDLKILEGNDWDEFRPRVLCVEVPEQHTSITIPEKSLHELLLGVGYTRICQTYQFGVPLNSIYIDET